MSLRKPRMAPVVPFRGGGPKDTDPYAVLSMHQVLLPTMPGAFDLVNLHLQGCGAVMHDLRG